jgi:hypothetical protein
VSSLAELSTSLQITLQPRQRGSEPRALKAKAPAGFRWTLGESQQNALPSSPESRPDKCSPSSTFFSRCHIIALANSLRAQVCLASSFLPHCLCLIGVFYRQGQALTYFPKSVLLILVVPIPRRVSALCVLFSRALFTHPPQAGWLSL